MQMISLVQDKIATKIKIEMVCNQRNAHRHRIQSAHNAHYILRVQRVEKTCRAWPEFLLGSFRMLWNGKVVRLSDYLSQMYRLVPTFLMSKTPKCSSLIMAYKLDGPIDIGWCRMQGLIIVTNSLQNMVHVYQTLAQLPIKSC